MKTLKKIKSFQEEKLEKLLSPVWESKEVTEETGLVVGEEGKVCLLAQPLKGSVEVKNIFHDVLYEEGIDYVVEGKDIRRIAGGNLPYFAVEEYFRKQPKQETGEEQRVSHLKRQVETVDRCLIEVKQNTQSTRKRNQ